MSRDRQAVGRRGEDAAADFLAARGHLVLARRFRVRSGELDLVTRSGEHLYFVEVKTRRTGADEDAFGGGLEAVDGRRRRRMVRAAEAFLLRFPECAPLVAHFAVIAIEPGPAGAQLTFLPDAFDASAA